MPSSLEAILPATTSRIRHGRTCAGGWGAPPTRASPTSAPLPWRGRNRSAASSSGGYRSFTKRHSSRSGNPGPIRTRARIGVLQEQPFFARGTREDSLPVGRRVSVSVHLGSAATAAAGSTAIVSGEAAVPPPLPPAPGNAQWEGSVRPIVIGFVVLAVLAIASCRYGVPVLASAAAERVPDSFVDLVGEQVLRGFDSGAFEPSALEPARQAAVVRRFSQLRFPSGASPADYGIVFRRSESVGANAMALPSGTIVVTDGLVALSGHEDELVGV